MTKVAIALISAIVGLGQAAMADAPIPVISVIDRVETPAAIMGQAKLVTDANGAKMYVNLEADVNPALLDVVAYDVHAQVLHRLQTQRPPSDKVLYFQNVGVNALNELLVIADVEILNTGVMTLFSYNLTKGTSTILSSSGRYPALADRLNFQGRNLALVNVGLADPGDPALIRVIDEDTGKIVVEKTLDSPVVGNLGVDYAGKLKALLMGNNVLSLLDVKSGTVTPLNPNPTLPTGYAMDIETSIGKLIQLSDSKTIALLKKSDLIEGKFKPIRTFPQGTEFVGGTPAAFAAVPYKTQISLIDLKTNQPVGLPILIPGRLPGSRGGASVTDILVAGDVTVAVVSQAKHPDSYMQGTILTYVDVKSGKVLYSSTSDNDAVSATLMLNADGRLLSVEVDVMGLNDHVAVIDLKKGSVISSAPNKVMGLPFMSGSGRLLAARATITDQVCIFDLLSPSSETCVVDPLINSGAQFGYQPFAVQKGQLELPLLGGLNNSRFPQMGFVDLRVD